MNNYDVDRNDNDVVDNDGDTDGDIGGSCL